jgi:prepilin-type N-terminal cleavage/methylation domain-containing protein
MNASTRSGWDARSGRRGSDSDPRRAAFTLVELLVAVAIGLLILTLAVPVLREIKRPPITQATKDFLDACSHARSKAIMEGVPTQLVIREAGAELSVELAPDGIVGATNGVSAESYSSITSPEGRAPSFLRRIDDPDVAFESINVNGRSFMQAPATAVRFFPNGTADHFEAVLSWQRREGRRLTIEAMTGLAEAAAVK